MCINIQKLALLFIIILTAACAKEDKTCDRHTLEYLHTQSEDLIADQASSEMSYKCGGEYNLISRTVDKRITYVFTCPNSCK